MGRIIGPGSSRNYGYSPRDRQPFFVTQIIRQYGRRGVVALLVAAVIAFAPLALLVWFNVARLSSVVASQCHEPVIVKPQRHQQEQEEDDKPGDTALLQVTCEVPAVGDWRELLCDEDPVRRNAGVSDSYYVRNERVYLRKAGDFNLPFGLLGKPPVSAWLPAGDYEILVVHDAPRAEQRIDARSHGFPLVTVFDACSLPAKEKTVRRIRLPHYDWGLAEPIRIEGQPSESNSPTLGEVQPICETIAAATAWPTPGGYVLSLGEPQVHHSDDHRQCTASFAALQAIPREWTRDQLASLRWWLPAEAMEARDKLDSLISALGWREFFEGWFCYAAAGIAGLVFTRWGALAILEPYRRRESFGESVKTCLAIFALAAGAWFMFQVLFNGSGCHGGAVPFRIR